MAEGQMYRYSPAAIRRICLPETRKQVVTLLPVLLVMEVAQYLAKPDFERFILSLKALVFGTLVFAAFYIWWRIAHLRTVFFRFDGTELIYDFEHDRRELLSTDVVSSVSTPRLIYITSKQKNYTVTIHSELDRFDELRSALASWLPANPVQWEPPHPPSFLRTTLTYLAVLGVTALVYRHLEGPWGFKIFLAASLTMLGIFWYQMRRRSQSPIPALPSHLVP